MIDKNENAETYMNSFVFPDPKHKKASDSEFVEDLLKVCNFVRCLLCLTASIDPTNNKNYTGKIQPILSGYIARIFKLYDTFVFLIAENKVEMAWIMTRLISEASIQLKYLLSLEDPEAVQKYLKASLVNDKLLFNHVNKQIDSRPPTAIEERIIKSITKEFEEAGYKPNEIDDTKDRIWCKNTFSLAEKVGLKNMYERVYRTSSTAIHGSWFHLKQYYLIKEHNSYFPNLDFHNASPQIIEGTTSIALDSAKNYAAKITGGNIIEQSFDVCIAWFQKMSEEHENFLKTYK